MLRKKKSDSPPSISSACCEKFYPGIARTPWCEQTPGHDGFHKGFGMIWERTPDVEPTIAERFLAAYRQIPNRYQLIFLRDDGTVVTSLGGFEAAVQFNDATSTDSLL